MKNLISIFVLFCAFSCNKGGGQVSESELVGCWSHDVENQDIDSNVSYLLLDCDAKEFPFIYFRYSLILEENGNGSEYRLAVNDGHFHAAITWRIEKDILLIDNGLSVSSYLIDDVDDESFTLTRQ